MEITTGNGDIANLASLGRTDVADFSFHSILMRKKTCLRRKREHWCAYARMEFILFLDDLYR